MAGYPNPLRRFFNGLLSIYRFIRSVLFNLLFLFLLAVFLGAMIGEPPAIVQPGSALLLNPVGVIVEQESYADPLALLANRSAGGGTGEVLLQDMLDAIRIARTDDRISSLLITTDWMAGVGLSQLQELGSAIQDFKTSGKKVYAWGGSFNQGQYYLAAQADEILLNSYGSVDIEGFAAWQNYFQDALEKLGINVHIFRVGEYKSAVEPFSRNDMSPESRENYTRLLQDLWRNYYTEIETRRELRAGTINDYINNLDTHLAAHAGNAAALALATGLVDRLDTQPVAFEYLKSEIGSFRDELKAVEFLRYVRGNRPTLDPNPDRIGVIVAQGNIVDGEAPLGQIGGDSLAMLIREAITNDNIKALVLRIDSPGGSAFASEVIRAELEAFRSTNRPLVVSMGSTAASGGYWIATPANQIWASPTTVTGSIGIFGAYPTFEESFAKLGIGTDGVSTTELAGFATVGRPLSQLASNALQLQVQDGYNRFINLVSAARGLSYDEVDQIAQGQVWSGEAALGHGLVDQLGGMQDALEAAANLANLSDYAVEVIQPRLSPSAQLLKELMQNTSVQALFGPLAAKLTQGSPVQQLMQKLQIDISWLLQANDPHHAYVDCLECRKLRL